MVLRALGVDPNNLSLDAIDAQIQNKTPESQYLEFKSELPGKKDEDKREFARDVAAMANGGGGAMLFGVLDEDDIAVKITPVPLGAEVTRLQQICATSIEPYLPMSFHELPIEENQGVIVIEIPASPRRPFATVEGSRFSFSIRVGRHKHPMIEAEIERMYRDRFQRQSDVAYRLEEVSSRAGIPVVGGPKYPRAFVAIVPEAQHDRLFRPTQQISNSLIAIDAPSVFYSPSIDVIPHQARPRFKRFEFSQGFDPHVLEQEGWIEIHDDGAFLGIITGDIKGSIEERSDQALFYDTRFIAEILTRLTSYRTLAEHLGVRGEIRVRAGITANRLPVELCLGPMRGEVYTSSPLQSAVVTEFTADVSDLAPGRSLLLTGKVLLDDLFTAFGWPECFQISVAGEIRSETFDRSSRQYVLKWAEDNGVALAGDKAT